MRESQSNEPVQAAAVEDGRTSGVDIYWFILIIAVAAFLAMYFVGAA
jgi:hypothetical protein